MLLHTNTTLSRVFAWLSDPARLAELAPLMLVGRSGTGKRHYLRHFVRHLNCQTYRPFDDIEPPLYCQRFTCELCERLETGKAIDYLQLSGNEGIAELRDRVAQIDRRTH